MKKTLIIFLLLLAYYPCYSQSVETSLYLREELVKQRNELISKVQEIQARIDAIDQKLGNKSRSSSNTQYLNKTVNYSNTNYSNSLKSSTNIREQKQYRSKKTRAYRRGPRGGCYYINSNGNKTYVARNMCN
ncbi:hypothetical protein [Aquimarina sediminis]|uniref:hypothetical protein n=1 Tax=Aquimarina sediminis TaxID=2070536 RepID=UPI000CA04F8E|nr:hypothetical protein [Aquimarina sediminis]